MLQIIENHLDIIISLLAILLAWFTYCKEKKANIIKKLAKQVIGFYCIEQEAIKKIHELTNEKEQTIQRELRENALKNDNNIEGIRPDMSANSARKYL